MKLKYILVYIKYLFQECDWGVSADWLHSWLRSCWLPMTCLQKFHLAFTACLMRWMRAQDILVTQWHPKGLQEVVSTYTCTACLAERRPKARSLCMCSKYASGLPYRVKWRCRCFAAPLWETLHTALNLHFCIFHGGNRTYERSPGVTGV